MVDAKVGDKVIRWLAGQIPMPMVIVNVTDDLIECHVTGEDPALAEALGAWTFDRITGAEVDDYLNWGPPPLMTGSFITKGETSEH